MSEEQEPEMPSADINPGNAIARVQECQKYMTLQLWTHYNFLYKHLASFQELRVRGAGKMFRDDDEFTKAWNALRTSSVDTMLKNLESAQSFNDFMLWIKRLSEIVQEPRSLWNIIHTEVQISLKVTLEQSQQIADEFFTKEMLFEFGLDSFLKSDLCDFTDRNNEDLLVDVFYAAAGYIRACQLPNNYEIKQQNFIDLVENILVHFTQLEDFDAHRFVWLVEVIHDHLHLSNTTLINTCKKVLEKFTSQKESGKASIQRLHKMCIISTSPFMQDLPMIREAIDKVFNDVLIEQHIFVRKYIFGCYVTCTWNGPEEPRLSDPLAAWLLYLNNLALTIKSKAELPDLLLLDFLDDSLSHFTGYYREVQPTKERAVNLRMDIFAIVDAIIKYYPRNFSPETLERIWFLLTIAAVCGATDEMLKDVKQIDFKDQDPYLGLKNNGKDFTDYPLALGRLLKKFEVELDSIPDMFDFIRRNYTEHPEDQEEQNEGDQQQN